nr:probable carboxylesterase 18 [Physcomitrium patens]|eukprot:XP_024376660.1 probable carboxylesterase 18 [Physcomitrella patens]
MKNEPILDLFLLQKSQKLYNLNKKLKPQVQKLIPVIFCHGGGFVFFIPNFVCYNTFCRRLARKCHALANSVHYRRELLTSFLNSITCFKSFVQVTSIPLTSMCGYKRALEHKFLVTYDDCFTALEWLQSGQATQYLPWSIDPPCTDLSRVYLCSDSAGGNIVHHIAIQASETDISSLCIKGLMLLSPLFGGQERIPAGIRVRNVPVVSMKRLDFSALTFHIPHCS